MKAVKQHRARNRRWQSKLIQERRDAKLKFSAEEVSQVMQLVERMGTITFVGLAKVLTEAKP